MSDKFTNEEILLIDELKKLGKKVTRQQIIQTGAEVGTDGIRLTQKIYRFAKVDRGLYDLERIPSELLKPIEVPKALSDDEREEKIKLKFAAMRVMAKATAQGKTRALIVSGPGGLGKTHEVLEEIKAIQPNFDELKQKISGMVRPTGLYKALFENSTPGSILLFDDADSIFYDDAALNLLKAACDTTQRRIISWRAETHMEDSYGEKLPPYFEFCGNVIFVTNKDFVELINSGSRISPHIEALKTRAHYLDLELVDREDKLLRIRQVMNDALARGRTDLLGASCAKDVNEIYDYMKVNTKDADLNLREVIKIAQLKHIAKDWVKLAKSFNK